MGLVVSDASTLIHLASIGLLGVLKQFFGHVAVPPAKREKVIGLLKPELDRLVRQSGFWIDHGLYEHALDSVGEKSE
jgi:predicted nucleic acid-binding protein